ncbi:hexosaminidase [Spirosomataceae bacterium TFI 002]|nr:hexosaminidase [Spirosomataceae bacterium TFI 002]
MKILFLLTFTLSIAFGQKQIQVIPQPNEISYGSGEYYVRKNIAIVALKELSNEAEFLAEVLEKGFERKTKIRSNGKGIHLKLIPDENSLLGKEGYTMSVGKSGIEIAAGTPTGIFRGIQTFRQLLPVSFEFGGLEEKVAFPYVTISDKPQFAWRAFMLDESRHFQGVDQVKKMLDQMAYLKMNKFHWHLTDDQGWRIEIKKYPKLTEIGSVRKDTQVARRSEERTGVPHSGFYTQEEIKEIIEYATARHITVIPEIEMPGHAIAAVAAYPWLGSLGTTNEVTVLFGKMEESFNISDPKVIDFLKDVLDEVIALFPGQVVHVGGDEVNFGPWEKSPDTQAFMAKNGLKSPADLQVYFTNQISNYIDSKGKRMMGWNEIMGKEIHEERTSEAVEVQQKLAKSAIVHFWKGDLSLINQAVESGYDVVNSNHWDTYMDYTFGRLPLSKSYAFNPIPEGLDEKYHKHILGSGTQVWTEYLPTNESLEKQVFPRLAAYSEVGWTSVQNKDFERFTNSLELLKRKWSLEGIYFTN